MNLRDIVLDLFGYTPPAASPPKRRPAARPAPAAPAAPAVRDEAAVLAVARGAGGEFRRVVFTRNRRVMASVAARGAELRLNAAFAAAPEAVLVAVAVLFSTPDRRKRSRARQAVRRFIAGIPAHPSAPARRARRVPAADRPHLERLRAEFDRVNREHFDGALPAVPLFLSGRMRSRNGHFSSHPPEIVLNRRLCVEAAAGEAEQTLRHEMIHLWQHAAGKRPDHGREFRAWARRLGVHPRATRPVTWRRG